jgi:ElaB/YqjD/DUF883 family membrane-anchored ribosome-binding protein
MSQAWPDDSDDLTVPEPDARPPVSPHVQGMTPSGEDPGSRLPPAVPPAHPSNPADAVPVPTPEHRGFIVQPGGRNAITGTAQRIGSAVGTAQRQVRRGLELVRPTARHGGAAASGSAIGHAEQAHPPEQDPDDLASRMIQAIEEEVAEVRRHATFRLGQFSEFGELAGDRLQQLRGRLRDALSRSRLRARQLAAEHPLQTIAAIAAIGFAFGFALRLRSSQRR